MHPTAGHSWPGPQIPALSTPALPGAPSNPVLVDCPTREELEDKTDLPSTLDTSEATWDLLAMMARSPALWHDHRHWSRRWRKAQHRCRLQHLLWHRWWHCHPFNIWASQRCYGAAPCHCNSITRHCRAPPLHGLAQTIRTPIMSCRSPDIVVTGPGPGTGPGTTDCGMCWRRWYPGPHSGRGRYSGSFGLLGPIVRLTLSLEH